MNRALSVLPLVALFVWAHNLDHPPVRECVEWEWVTVTFNGRHIGNGHIGPVPHKVRTCKQWVDKDN